MSHKGTAPKGGTDARSWTFDKVGAGCVRSGWLAGDIHGIVCHCSGASKPCRLQLPGDCGPCPECDAGKGTAWVGYVPLRREDGRPICVCIRESTFEIAQSIKPGERVQWGRDEGRGESVWILPRATGHIWRHFYGDQLPNADLTAWLVRLWKLPDLLPAVRLHFSPASGAPQQVETQKPVSQGVRRDEDAMLAAHSKLKTAGEVSDTLVAQFKARGRLPEESMNGKHGKR